MKEEEISTLYLSISGELDQHRAGEIIEEIREKIHCTLPKKLILDLQELTFSDSSGIALLLRVKRSMTQIEGELEIRNTQAQPEKLFRIAGLSSLLQS
ncbi:MAG: STAS domain-containing protein [Eubacteriales bacterium]